MRAHIASRQFNYKQPENKSQGAQCDKERFITQCKNQVVKQDDSSHVRLSSLSLRVERFSVKSKLNQSLLQFKINKWKATPKPDLDIDCAI